MTARSRILPATGALAYKEWKGRFYPDDLPATEALPFYARTFSALELNTTFYRTPSPSAIKELIARAPAGFVIAVKAPRLITHIKRLNDCQEPAKRFFESLTPFGDYQGPVLVQLPPNFKIDQKRLEAFFALVPKEVRIAMEFRHASWFEDSVLAFLRSEGAALVFNDTDGPEGPLISTADWGYLRLRRLTYTREELQDWAQAIRAQKWNQAFVVFKHEETCSAPNLAKRFRAFL